jgi:ferrous iron transport protein B
MRLKWFIKEAVPFVLLGVLIANLLYTFGIIQFIGKISAPVINQFLGLPEESAGALIMGFLRKDLAVGMLIPLNMTLKQLIVASVVLSMYFPCVATFAVLLKELGVIDLLKSTLIMILSAFITGGLLNIILSVTLK